MCLKHRYIGPLADGVRGAHSNSFAKHCIVKASERELHFVLHFSILLCYGITLSLNIMKPTKWKNVFWFT